MEHYNMIYELYETSISIFNILTVVELEFLLPKRKEGYHFLSIFQQMKCFFILYFNVLKFFVLS